MKILFVTTISDTVNSFLIPHIKFLINNGNDVGIATNIFQEIHPTLLDSGCEVFPIEFQRNPLKKDNLSAFKKIKKIIKEKGYELVHVHTPVASFLTRLACRNLTNVNILYTAHGFHFFKGSPTMNWLIYFPLEKIAAKWTDGLITMNDEDYYSARKLVSRKEIAVYKVHGIGLDLNKFVPQTMEAKLKYREKYNYNSGDFILVYVGELSHRKHQDLLIKAMKGLKEKIPKIKLLLIGDGELRGTYEKLIDSLGLENHIELLGYRKDVAELMIISDLAVSTSRQEGLPVNVMEAMATGLPLVVTNCRGNRDLVTDGINGFILDRDDINECANAIEKLYVSEELRQEFGEKNKELIKRYSLENVINEMEEIYRQSHAVNMN